MNIKFLFVMFMSSIAFFVDGSILPSNKRLKKLNKSQFSSQQEVERARFQAALNRAAVQQIASEYYQAPIKTPLSKNKPTTSGSSARVDCKNLFN